MNVEKPASPTQDIALVLVAFHHSLGNIAAQRFRGLLRYLPQDRFAVHVLTSKPEERTPANEPGTYVVDGSLVAKSPKFAMARAIMTMFRLLKIDAANQQGRPVWLENIVAIGRDIVQRERAKGRRVIVIGTYSPIDALIAARLIAQAENVPLLQDFRDGMAFESLGRPGKIAHFLRVGIERWAAAPATCLTSVSRPLVNDFQRRYPSKRVELLYNGFDSAEYPRIEGQGGKGQGVRIGHFGRISESDASSFEGLHRFINLLEANNLSNSNIFEFYGSLSSNEKTLLSQSTLNCIVHGHVSRDVVYANMERMSALLLVTGRRESVATGKIFEYLCSGRRICLVTMCKNEAAQIIYDIGDDDIVIDFSNPDTIPAISDFENHLSRPFTRNYDRIARFEKSAQAEELAAILQSAALTRKGAKP